MLDAAKRLSADLTAEGNPGDGLVIFSRLVSDPGMRHVWRTLYKKKRHHYEATDEFYYPATVTMRTAAKICRQRADELSKPGRRKQRTRGKIS